jgi:hypothetical protein
MMRSLMAPGDSPIMKMQYIALLTLFPFGDITTCGVIMKIKETDDQRVEI